MVERRLYDYDSAATYLGVPRARLEGWVKRRRITVVKPGGRSAGVLFDKIDLDRFIEANKISAGRYQL